MLKVSYESWHWYQIDIVSNICTYISHISGYTSNSITSDLVILEPNFLMCIPLLACLVSLLDNNILQKPYFVDMTNMPTMYVQVSLSCWTLLLKLFSSSKNLSCNKYEDKLRASDYLHCNQPPRIFCKVVCLSTENGIGQSFMWIKACEWLVS